MRGVTHTEAPSSSTESFRHGTRKLGKRAGQVSIRACAPRSVVLAGRGSSLEGLKAEATPGRPDNATHTCADADSDCLCCLYTIAASAPARLLASLHLKPPPRCLDSLVGQVTRPLFIVKVQRATQQIGPLPIDWLSAWRRHRPRSRGWWSVGLRDAHLRLHE